MPSSHHALPTASVCGLTACLVGLSFSFSLPAAQAQTPINQATITEILDGTEVFIQDSQAQVGDQATFGQRVSTGNARTQLRFNTDAVGRLSTNSVLTIGQCAELSQGSVLVNGAINGCTTSIVAGVRGTTYIVTIDEAGEESVTVLEGEVSLQRQFSPDSSSPDPASPAPSFSDSTSDAPDTISEPVTLTAGQTVAVSETGPFGIVETLDVADFRRLIEGVLFTGFTEELPGMAAIRQSFDNLYPGASFPTQPSVPNTAPSLPVRPRF
ncbi:MAG: FecR domain-containing protein [Cyanothece sp. SIO2G6]|nr:FecR domain-containing protein [Cyanothece sp. SIO2G6]